MRENRELSREEEAELSRSKKKVKEGHHADSNEGLRAYAKAFDFTDLMDTEADSDEKVEELREGLAVVKLTRETKLRIRKPWTNALIIKLYGRALGLNVLRSKLNLLWKPAGSLDCVDLGKEFYSVRFSLKEDMDAVLRNGPWFIAGHFLSIRPWEPFFKPDCPSLSSIAFWVRLHALPLELYEAKVLKQIGEAIRRVLQIDSHTAMEARGRKEACPLTIKKPEMLAEGGSGTSNDRGAGSKEDRYGPWMLVARRKPGQIRTNALATTGFRPESKGNIWGWSDGNKGREANGSLNVGQESIFGLKKVDHTETRYSPSIKDKKDLARNRASKWVSKPEIGGVGKVSPNTKSAWTILRKEGDGVAANSREDDSAERALPVDSDQRKEGGTTANNSEVRSKPSGDKSSTSTNVLNTVPVLSKDLSCDQANTRAQ
nr:hypothetical protein CFP56_23035 [Quercus suber]